MTSSPGAARTAGIRNHAAVCGALVVAAAPFARAQVAPHELEISDRLPKFEAFYAEATQAKDEQTRWALWKKDYGIAAVPPTPEGEALARKQLDAAWSRYPALIPSLPSKATAASTAGRELFDRVNALFATSQVPIHTRLVLFVGQFDGNEFTTPAMDGRPPTVVMPVESPSLRLDLAHELAHSVNFQLAGVKNSFGAPLGETVFLEGLAMHAAKAVAPGRPDAAYTELASEPGWMDRCKAHRAAISQEILGQLDKSGADVAAKFTFGKGAVGLDRELYCAGWFAVGRLLAEGRTFPQLARVPEDQMVATIRSALQPSRRGHG